MNGPGPVPIVVAITGHRDLRESDCDLLQHKVGEIFDELRCAYRSSPLLLLSPLATGADQLTARVALGRGIRIVAPLPLPLDEYRRDFTAAGEREKFEQLLARAEGHYFVGFAPSVDVRRLADEAQRSLQYDHLGQHLAAVSHILIALWNGKQTGKVGGTAQVVRYKLERVPRSVSSAQTLLDLPDNGPVYQVIAPRQSDPETIGEPGTVVRRYPRAFGTEAEATKCYRRLFGCIDAFNRDAVSFRSRTTWNLFSLADDLANVYQRRWIQTMDVIFGAAFCAVASFSLYVHFWHTPWLLLVNLVFVGVAGLELLLSKYRNFETRAQDYRALSIALQIADVWRSAGVDQSVAGSYLRKQRGELDWIRMTLRVQEWSQLSSAVAPAEDPAVARAWIDGQLEYFRRAMARDEGRRRRHSFLAVGGAAVAAALVATTAALGAWGHLGSSLREQLVLTTVLIAVLAALVHNYAEKRAYAEQAKRYAMVAPIFETAQRLYSERATDRKALLLALGKEALIENGDWVLMHRARPLELEQFW